LYCAKSIFTLISASIHSMSSNGSCPLDEFSSQIAILYMSKNDLLGWCDPSCNATCQFCENSICRIFNNSCYIVDQCYAENQTSSNGSLSCLQCQPKKNQTQWSFNPECSANASCQNELFCKENTCPSDTIAAFYQDPQKALIDFYNFNECGRDRKQCQAGFFLVKNATDPLACCAGYFCPAGQVCMIPCRPGSYCPSPLQAVDGICQTSVACPVHQPSGFEQ